MGMTVALRTFPDYRNAFADFSLRARQAQALTAAPNPDRQAIDAALLELEKARAIYNHQRDILARQFLNSELPEAVSVSDRVKEVAELRWELTGKPEGTAEDDWYRAEEIVRLAAAA